MGLSHDPNWLRAGNWITKTDYADFAIVGVGASKSALTPNRAYKTPDAIREALLKYSTYNASQDIDLAKSLAAGDLGDVRKPDDRELRDNESVVRGRGRRSRRDVKTAPLQDLVKCVFFLLNPHTLLLD